MQPDNQADSLLPQEPQVATLPPEPQENTTEPQVDSLPQQQEPYHPPHLEQQDQYVLVTGLSI